VRQENVLDVQRVVEGGGSDSDKRDAGCPERPVYEEVPEAALGARMRAVVHLKGQNDPKGRGVAEKKIDVLLSDEPAVAHRPGFALAGDDVCETNLRGHGELGAHRLQKCSVEEHLVLRDERVPGEVWKDGRDGISERAPEAPERAESNEAHNESENTKCGEYGRRR
jgi:hypothetical protein